MADTKSSDIDKKKGAQSPREAAEMELETNKREERGSTEEDTRRIGSSPDETPPVHRGVPGKD